MTLVEFYSNVPAINEHRSGSSLLRSFGHTAFVSSHGVAGVFLGCFEASTCGGSLGMSDGSTNVGSRGSIAVTTLNGGIAHLTLTSKARSLLMRHGTLVVRLTVRGPNGGRQSSSLMLVKFL